ncbi:5-oxoprolinase subunit PxpB [Paenibacillus sp. Z6-24]
MSYKVYHIQLGAKGMSAMEWTIHPLGDSAVLIEFGSGVQEDTLAVIQTVARQIEEDPFPGWIECVPSYTTLAVYYDLAVLSLMSHSGDIGVYEKVSQLVEQRLLAAVTAEVDQDSTIVEIPVCYGGEYGPDLDGIAAANGLTAAEVIHIHAGAEYTVYAIGFAPGFPYLGGMPPQIAAPRKATPRLTIPAGSVGIAGTQTGIYPLETPGGWQLIGRTPIRLFRPEGSPPSLLESGHRVRFRPITAEQYVRLQQQESAGLSRSDETGGCE